MQLLKDLMSRDVKVVSPDMTIEEAARKMRDGDFGMMPAGEGDRMIGTISDRDRRLVGIVALGDFAVEKLGNPAGCPGAFGKSRSHPSHCTTT
jgi:predicted transcriptional regulator